MITCFNVWLCRHRFFLENYISSADYVNLTPNSGSFECYFGVWPLVETLLTTLMRSKVLALTVPNILSRGRRWKNPRYLVWLQHRTSRGISYPALIPLELSFATSGAISVDQLFWPFECGALSSPADINFDYESSDVTRVPRYTPMWKVKNGSE